MNFEPAEKMKNFEAGIFQILDEKKKELQKQGKKIYSRCLLGKKEPAARRKGRTAASLLLFIGKVREACCCERSEQEHEFL